MYPDASCDPESYRVTLEKAPLYPADLGGNNGSPDTFWTPATALDPHSEYRWTVAAQVGATAGPANESKHFFTGPTCTAGQLPTPTLMAPANGAVLTDNQVVLTINYPGECLPPGARIDLATDAGFVHTTAITQVEPIMDWYLEPLEDCTTYFWRAASVSGSTLSPYSGPSSFSTNFSGTCPSKDLLSMQNLKFYCVDKPLTFMAELFFDHAVTGQFELRFTKSAYPCFISPAQTNKLTCYGPRIESNLAVTLELWDLGSHTLVSRKETKTPDCTLESIPDEPAGGSQGSADCGNYYIQRDCESVPSCQWIKGTTVGYCTNR
jgi:hypothetical protein